MWEALWSQVPTNHPVRSSATRLSSPLRATLTCKSSSDRIITRTPSHTSTTRPPFSPPSNPSAALNQATLRSQSMDRSSSTLDTTKSCVSLTRPISQTRPLCQSRLSCATALISTMIMGNPSCERVNLQCINCR